MFKAVTNHLPGERARDFVIESWHRPAGSPPANDRVALLSDLHLPGDSQTEISGINPAGHLEAVLQRWGVEPSKRPDCVLIAGDCAMVSGFNADYQQLASLMGMVDAMGLPWRAVLGNHDCRENYRAAFGSHAPGQPALASRHVGVIETPVMIWILLDSLDQVNAVPGQLGNAQLGWLRDLLATLPAGDKPVVVMGHHNLQFKDSGEDWFGLRDSAQLMDLLESHKRVKAYVFGHSHCWQVGQRESGLWLINLPAVSFAFHPDQPVGWVEGAFEKDGVDLQLRPLRDNGDATATLSCPTNPPAPPSLRLNWR
jgi:3',5'-cyclic AMP phosphodiesterase CpdA